MESRKMVLMNLFARQQWRCKHKRTDFWTQGDRGWEGGGGTYGGSMEAYTLTFVK